MKKLLIHCGTTKTGTSAIQYGLGLNQKELLNYSINYPLDEQLKRQIKKGFSVRGNADKLINFAKYITPNKKSKEGSKERFIKFLEDCNSTGADLTIFSSEAIPSSVDNDSIKELRDLLLEYFDNVKIIYYVRDVLDHSVSQYNEFVKRRKLKKPFNEYGLNYICHFREQIEKLLTGFGESNVEIKNYADEKNDLWRNFIKNLGIKELDPNNLISPKRINRSLCKEELEVYRVINKNTNANLAKHLLGFWENYKPITKEETIPSLEVLNLFEKKHIEQVNFINKILKDSSNPLKIVSNNLKDKIKSRSNSFKENEINNYQNFFHLADWIYLANSNYIEIISKENHNFDIGDLIELNFESGIYDLFPSSKNKKMNYEISKITNKKQFAVEIENSFSSDLKGKCKFIKYKYLYFIELISHLIKKIENRSKK